MGTELYRFFFEHNRNNSAENNLFGLQSLLQIFLRIKKVGKRTIGHGNSGGSFANFSILNLNARTGQCDKKREL